MFRITPPESQSDKNLTTSRPRIAWLDSLKGFAIICVVLGHVFDGYLNAGAFPEYRCVEYSIFQAIYTFHMPLFFLVSGFMYAMAYFDAEGRPKWAKLKWQLPNIAIVYFLFTALLVSFRMLFARYANNDASWSDLLCSPWRPFSLYWYLYVLAVLYIVCLPLPRLRKGYLLLPVFLVLSLLASDIPFVFGFAVQYRFLFFAIYFFIGIVLFRAKVSVSWLAASLGFVASFVLSLLFWGGGSDWPNDCLNHQPYLNTLVALGFCLFFWKLFSSVKALNVSLLNLCGRYCLEIYVTHCFLTAGFRSILPALGLTNFWLNVVLNTVLSTALPLLFAIVLQRIGFHDILFRPAYFIKSRIEARAKP